MSILQGYDLQNHAIGQGWFPNTLAQVVNYPASNGLPSGSLFAPGTNDAVALGRQLLHDQIMTAVANPNGSPVHIAALSQGTIVANRELAYLATNPNAPPANGPCNSPYSPALSSAWRPPICRPGRPCR